MSKSSARNRAIRQRIGSHSTKPLATGRFLEAPAGEFTASRGIRRMEEYVTALKQESESLHHRISECNRLISQRLSPQNRMAAENERPKLVARLQDLTHRLVSYRSQVVLIRNNANAEALKEAVRSQPEEICRAILAQKNEILKTTSILIPEIDLALKESAPVLGDVCPGCKKTVTAKNESGRIATTKIVVDAQRRRWHRSCAREWLGKAEGLNAGD